MNIDTISRSSGSKLKVEMNLWKAGKPRAIESRMKSNQIFSRFRSNRQSGRIRRYCVKHEVSVRVVSDPITLTMSKTRSASQERLGNPCRTRIIKQKMDVNKFSWMSTGQIEHREMNRGRKRCAFSLTI